MPSRVKIALLSAGISGVVLAAFGAVMWTLIRDMRIEAVDREIRTLGSRHPGLFAGRDNYERLTDWLEFTFAEDYTNHIILLIQDAAGRTRYSSPHWPAGLDPGNLTGIRNATNTPSIPAKTNPDRNSTATEPGVGGRRGMGHGAGWSGPPAAVVFTKPPRFWTEKAADSIWRFGALADSNVTLVIGLSQQEVEDELNRVRATFLLTLPVALFLVALGGWVVAGRALHPLKTIADTAERVTARGLDQRIPEVGDSPEGGRVIQVLNRMMDRLETSFQQATRFSADVSHELKTPLAVMQGELENALHLAAPGSTEQQLFSELLEQTQRLKTITRSLLLLAQADAGHLKLTVESVNLSAELEPMIEDARALALDRHLTFDASIQPQVRIEADRALLHTALFNLINNAVKYNEPDGSISLRLDTAGNRIRVTVGNSGPGIPAADQPRVFERFYRAGGAGTSHSDGIGLGLSLAREIVRAHGGDVMLVESRPGWTCFKAEFNARQAPL